MNGTFKAHKTYIKDVYQAAREYSLLFKSISIN
jgi:hypothetical protein